MTGLVLGLAGIVAYVAYRTRRVPTPRRRWWRFHRRNATPLPAALCEGFAGIYTIEEGKEFFGNTAVVKCSYTIERGKKLVHISLFCEKNGTYIICEARQRRGAVLLYGHWRKAAANGVGLVHLVLQASNNENPALATHPSSDLHLAGHYGFDKHKPQKPLRFRYQRALPPVGSFEIIGHRGGARNVDFLPVSENSLEMMKMAARLGATGVEIDVRMTKDKVPVIFHDSFLSVHTIKGPVYGGLLHNYTLQELKNLRLRKGGRMPTLDECLHTILHKTPLQTVWLDMKKESNLEPIRQLQQQYMQRASAIGRTLVIYIGVPDTAVLKCFTALPDHLSIPSLTELEPEIALRINANVWAPQYTGGFQRQKVAGLQAAGKKAFVWSLDSKFLIDLFMAEGGFDGLVTNTPAVVTHWLYTAKTKALSASPESFTHHQ